MWHRPTTATRRTWSRSSLVVIMACACLWLSAVSCHGSDDPSAEDDEPARLYELLDYSVRQWRASQRAENSQAQSLAELIADPAAAVGDVEAARNHLAALQQTTVLTGDAAASAFREFLAGVQDETWRRQAETLYIAPRVEELRALYADLEAWRQTPPTVADGTGEAIARWEREGRQRREHLATLLTELETLMPSSVLVHQADSLIVRTDYRRLLTLLQEAPEPLDQAGQARLQAELSQLKRLYPRSPLTRRAERHLVPLLAPHTLSETRWQAFLVLGLLAVVFVAGWTRVVMGLLGRREQEEETPPVLRPAMVTPLAASQRRPPTGRHTLSPAPSERLPVLARSKPRHALPGESDSRT